MRAHGTSVLPASRQVALQRRPGVLEESERPGHAGVVRRRPPRQARLRGEAPYVVAIAALQAGQASVIVVAHGESGRSRLGAPYVPDPASPGGQFVAVRLPKISSALVGCGARGVPEVDRRSRPSGRSREAGAHCGKMIDRAAAPGLLGRDECVGHAAPATNGRAPRSAAAGASGHGAALAPRPSRPPPCCRLPAQALGTASDRSLRAGPGAAPGAGEPRLGVSAPARRTACPGREGGRFHRLGELAGGRHRSSTRAGLQHPSGPPAPGRTSYAPRARSPATR